MKRIYTILLFVILIQQVKAAPYSFDKDIQPAVFSATLVMMHDVVDPPLASRYYSYILLGADALISRCNKEIIYPSLYINSFPDIKITEEKNSFNYQLAAVVSIYESAKNLLPSGYRLEETENKYIEKIRKEKIAGNIIDQSIIVGKEISQQIVAYSRTDNYFKLSTLLNYTPKRGEGYWYPTPPGYLEAVQPNWKTIRPMIIDSSGEFKPAKPVPFSKDSLSSFYHQAMEIHNALQSSDSVQRMAIAAFWDCNPFAISTAGHMSLGFKKMSPGGHWMNISAIASEKAKVGFDKSVEAQTLTALALMDAFISCWEEKYRSERIRPETYINRYIDIKWAPLLQTPPFPEYTSGHSVISSAAAEVLTYLLGDNFSFTDDTEIMFELSPRSFHSFREAANEAAISRLYGGIHFRDAVENGQQQGKAVGGFIVKKIQAAGLKPLL